MCDPDGELALDGLDALASLVDKSLVRQLPDAAGQPRFGMLETIREYAVERLSETEDGQATRRRHQDHFAALANRAQPELLGARQGEWLDRLKPTVTTSGPRCRTPRTTVEPTSRLASARRCGGSGSSAVTSPRVAPRSRASSPCRPRLLGHPLGRSALAGLGGLRYWQGDLAAAGEAYAEALEIERGLDDPRGLAEALYDAGFVAAITGDHATARTDYEESLEIYRAPRGRSGRRPAE